MDKIGLSKEYQERTELKAKGEDLEEGVSDLSVVPSEEL